jgi:ApbE superfamily uncharacterized protein (UPF0280 family)
MALDAKTSKLILEPVAFAIAASVRSLIANGVDPIQIIQMLLDNATDVTARVEPPGVRQKFVEGLVDSIPSMVRDHVAALRPVAGSSLILPGRGNGAL